MICDMTVCSAVSGNLKSLLIWYAIICYYMLQSIQACVLQYTHLYFELHIISLECHNIACES